MDNELLKVLGNLLDEKLAPIKDDINSLKTDVGGLKDDVNNIKIDINNIKSDVGGLKTDVGCLKTDVGGSKDDVNNIKIDIKYIKTNQEESFQILKSLEHKAEVNKAEHDKFINELAHLSQQIESMRKDLSTVEIVTARNMENIAQLKIIK